MRLLDTVDATGGTLPAELPGLRQAASWFFRLRRWVIAEIRDMDDSALRAFVIRKFIKIASVRGLEKIEGRARVVVSRVPLTLGMPLRSLPGPSTCPRRVAS